MITENIELLPYTVLLVMSICVTIILLNLIGNYIKDYVEENMFQEFEFEYELYVDNELVDEGEILWNDRGVDIGKDNARLCLQMDWKDKNGVWPRCEIKTKNLVIKNVGE